MSTLGSILVIEDEASIADTLRYALTTEGFGVELASTAGAGEGLFADGDFDLVILDVGLPDKSGFDVCRDLRKVSSVPVLFLTARSDEIDRIVGLELGADDYVSKPFSPREVAARVKAILRRAQGKVREGDGEGKGSHEGSGGIDEICIGELVADVKRYRVTYRGEVLDLARYEYGVLVALMQRPGWVFSREQLMDKVWDEPDASLMRTVDAHVKTIRAKMRAVEGGEDLIETHRGVGYALKEASA